MMMKKLTSLLLALLLTFSLTACMPEVYEEPEDLARFEESLGQEEQVQQPEQEQEQQEAEPEDLLPYDGTYTTKEDVALYLHLYGELPQNFITKKEARALGWEGGSLEPYAPGKCIGGSYFGNNEELLPLDREYKECDINTLGAKKRGAERLVYSDDGLIYYTPDHYETFELLYGEE